MQNAKRVLHVVFGPSAGGSLRRAIEQAGRDDEVIAQIDDFSFGPIAPPAPALRSRWMREVLGWNWYDELDSPALDLTRDIAFWKKVTSYAGRLVVWVSRRSARDYAGFLAFVSQLAGRACDVVDVTDYVRPGFTNKQGSFVEPRLVGSVNLITPPLFLGMRFLVEPLR